MQHACEGCAGDGYDEEPATKVDDGEEVKEGIEEEEEAIIRVISFHYYNI